MKRLVVILLLGSLLQAQAPVQEAKPVQETKPAAEAPPAEAPKPADSTAQERMFEGTLDVGTRWQQNVSGSRETYRSVVNLGEGVRLMDWDARFHSGTWKATSRGAGWGGDPSEWLQLSIEQKRFLRVSFDHRNTAYFNNLPSFANPLLERGLLSSERAFDTRRQLSDVLIEFLPGAKIIPYLGYMRDKGAGRGITNFVSDANEYPVLTNLNDRTHLARGGVRVELRRFHATLEQGGIIFNDDQTVTNASPIRGNVAVPFLGRTLLLDNLIQAYGVEGSSVFTKGLFTLQPFDMLDISAAIQFSQPRNDVHYRQANDGLFIDLDSLQFFNSQNLRIVGAAKQPHFTANIGEELRPTHRVKVVHSYFTDRLHNSSRLENTLIADRLEWTYDQHQIEAIFEPLTRVTLRGGYRYLTGDSFGRAPLVSQLTSERAQLRRNVALLGGAFRATDRASVNADVELGRGDRVIFRTSLSNYDRIRLRGRYQLQTNLQMYGTLQYLNNSNPAPLNPYEFRSQQTALGLHWTPNGGGTFQMNAEYGRTTLKSDLTYLVPQELQPQRSLYRENSHTVTGLVNYRMAIGWTWHPTLSAGGSMFLANGSRPTNFYQPVVRLSAPVGKRLDLFAEYRWYGMSQQLYLFEGFRSHQGIVGIRILGLGR